MTRARSTVKRPTEADEQAIVCQWLDANRIVYTSVPNGAHLAGDAKQRAIQMAKLKRTGLQPGFPDLMIFSRPYHWDLGISGVAVEMKRDVREKPSPEQEAWFEALGNLGWVVIVGHGAGDAILKLREMGYGR